MMLTANSLLTLPLDIKCCIAHKIADVYFWFVLNDPEFKQYAPSDRLNYIDQFTVIKQYPYCTITILFGKSNSINDQPACIYECGRLEWHRNGLCHRCNVFHDPAVITESGSKEWYYHGDLHRDNDQPALIDVNGLQEWYYHGERHRDNDQPAIIRPSNFGLIKIWYRNGINVGR